MYKRQVYDKSYQANLTDASSIAQAIKATGAEVILGSMVGQDSKTISEAFAAIDYHPLWLGVSALLSYGETMGEACNGQMEMCIRDSVSAAGLMPL